MRTGEHYLRRDQQRINRHHHPDALDAQPVLLIDVLCWPPARVQGNRTTPVFMWDGSGRDDYAALKGASILSFLIF